MRRRGVKITLVTCLVVLVGLFVCLLWPVHTTASKTEVSISEIGGKRRPLPYRAARSPSRFLR